LAVGRELPSGFVEIPLDRVEVIGDGVSGLRSFVLGRAWEGSPSEGFLLLRGGPLGRESTFHYAFDAEGFGILAGRALEVGEDDLDNEALQNIFHVHEWSRIDLIPEGADIGRAALVMAPAGPTAIQVPGSGKDPDRAERPPEAIVGAERPVAANGGGSTRGVAANGGGEAAEPRAAEPELARRTPHLDLTNENPAPGETFDVSVYVDTAAARPGEEVEEIAIELPPDLDRIDLHVWLVPSAHFEVTGARVQVLGVARDEERSASLVFPVRVKADVTDTTDAAISAAFSYRGRPAGKVTRPVELAVAAPPAPGPIATAAIPVPARVVVDPSAAQPDLTVDVFAKDRSGQRFECTVTSPHLPDSEPAPWEPGRSTDAIVVEYMNLFTSEGISNAQRMARLKAAGKLLFGASPENFQQAFWTLVDAGKLQTIYVASSEPYFPWELMVPSRPGTADRPALGVEFIVGRWPHPGHESPRQLRPLEDSYVVAPTYTETSRKLEKLEEEADFVKQRFSGEVIAPASFDALDARLGARGTALLHFVCHGEAGAGTVQVIRLDDPDKTLNSLELSEMEGAKLALGAKHPLVFLNACEVGRAAPALVGLGGFGASFVALGARCVIAPLWSVKDTVAHEVAVEFYETVLAEPTTPFAEILRRIRAKAYVPGGGEDTWAAYCFYGDPFTAAAAA
jgi:hypothetical protein